MPPPRGPFDVAPPSLVRRSIPWASVMLGSLATVWPMIASVPLLPPFGLIALLAWRLLRPEVFRVWAPLPLGFFDDLVSGQPLGNAMLLWTLCFLMIDLIDARLVAFRDFWQDWLIASGAIGFCLIAGRLIAVPLGAHVDTVLLAQAMVSAMLFPVAARGCAWLDRRRGSV